jgi:hypothetical protein
VTSLADSPAAVDAAIKAQRDAASKYTLMDIRQGPGEGNYDRVERLTVEDMLRAAEGAAVDEQDTLVLKTPPPSEGGNE